MHSDGRRWMKRSQRSRHLKEYLWQRQKFQQDSMWVNAFSDEPKEYDWWIVVHEPTTGRILLYV